VSSGGIVAESSPMDLRYTATRVAMWFIMESKRMVKQGKTAQEIIERLNNFRHVLKDWRDHPVPLPSDEFPPARFEGMI
jgi:hypothetical protein